MRTFRLVMFGLTITIAGIYLLAAVIVGSFPLMAVAGVCATLSLGILPRERDQEGR